MKFTIHAFDIQKQSNGLIPVTTTTLAPFWNMVAATDADLPFACGCYVFGIRASRGSIPWYVGLTHKQCFQDECFTPHNTTLFNSIMPGRKGTPVLILIAKRTPGGRFAKPTVSQHQDIALLEDLLIGAALDKNATILNTRQTAMLRTMEVPGFLNTPHRAPTLDEREFTKLLR